MLRTLALLALAALLSACSPTTATTGATASMAAALPPAATSSAPVAASATTTPTRVSPTATSTPTDQPTATATSAPTDQPTTSPAPPRLAWSYPLGRPGQLLGDGFFIRHGYITENTWYNPGDWHTGEDWYALAGDTVGASVYAVGDGTVVYAGSNYPGRVVIIKHGDNLFSMYGHLDPALNVQDGQRVQRGDLLGTVAERGDDVPNHLHFEIRTFLTTPAVNGANPRYDYRCGPNCVPGPGYWPISASDLPTALGWRNPTHMIARRAWPADGPDQLGEVVVATEPVSSSIALYGSIADDGTPQAPQADLALEPGARYMLLEQRSGPEEQARPGATAYELWYRVQLPDGRTGWIAALAATDFETGSDGQPATIRFNLYPASIAP